ncbi:hypothetical protein DENSPDRAFT_836695 [Dentipellis sp. KUC8613]|nr:hypothetical protein DENSPDRAFT_836695 [Dentipellis sp. KUC8613]
MGSRFAAAVVLALAALGNAAIMQSMNVLNDGPAPQCDFSALRCCRTVEPASSRVVAPVLAKLNVQLLPYVPVGLVCASSEEGECSGKLVCCSNNNFGGVIALGCVEP